MRGVSSGQIARDQPGVKEQVGAYLDESVISLSLFTPDIDLFDMNRVEVLRGPQGTLFGSGSVGGTVRYISNQPELGATSGLRRGRRQHHRRRRHGRQLQGGLQRASGQQGGPARGRVLQPARRLDGRRAARLQRQEGRQRRRPLGRAARDGIRSDRRTHDHSAVRLPEGEDGRLEPHRHLQHPGQSLHDDTPARHAGRAPALHPDRRALHRQVLPRRLQGELQLRQRHRSDVDHLLHPSRHPGRARCDRADRQHHRRLDRPAGEHLHARRAAERQDARERLDAGAPRLGRRVQQPLQVAGRRLLRRRKAPLQPGPDRQGFELGFRVPGVFGICIPTKGDFAPKDHLYFSDIRYKDRQYGILRRGDLLRDRPLQPDRGPALLQLQGRQGPRSSTACSPPSSPPPR